MLGAAGGVGSTLVQIARSEGVSVIGTVGGGAAGAGARRWAPRPLDYRSEDVPARVRELAPDGDAGEFDNVGRRRASPTAWRMLARGGTLVSDGTASTKDDQGYSRLPVLSQIERLMLWNAAAQRPPRHVLQPLGRQAPPPQRFQPELQRRTWARVFALMAEGTITRRWWPSGSR